MKMLLNILLVYGAYKIYKAIQGGTGLDIDIKGLGIEGGVNNFIIVLKTQVYNPGSSLKLNSIVADICMNNKKIGLISYYGNNIIENGYTDIKIPVILESPEINLIIDAIINLDIYKLTVEGEVTINEITLPYTDNLISNA